MNKMRSLTCTSWLTRSALLLVLSCVAAHAQGQVAGYLSRVPAASLRFAPPPKPPVAQLALSGIRSDPAPYLNDAFRTEQAAAQSKPINLQFLDPQRPRRQESGSSTALTPSIISAELEVLSPQALVRFFEPKPNVTAGSLKPPPTFQVPIKKTRDPGVK